MRKLLIAMGVSAALGVSASAQAGEWTLLAGTKAGYEMEPVVSLMVGQLEGEGSDADTEDMTGVEFSLNCPLIQPPSNRIRQQVSLTQTDTITSIELNPHYVVEVADHLEVGGGPGLGYVMTDAGTKDPSFFALQVGASIHYTGLPVFLGAEWRYQLTTEEEFAPGIKDDINNTRFAVKVGYAF